MLIAEKQWRAGAADDADKAATTTEQFVTQTRHAGVREVLAFMRGAHAIKHFTSEDRRAHAVRVLAASVERQARVSGCGRVTIPVGGAA